MPTRISADDYPSSVFDVILNWLVWYKDLPINDDTYELAGLMTLDALKLAGR